MLWPPDAKSQFIRKDPDAGKDLRKEKGTIEDEMVGWHHQLNGRECEQGLGDGEGQRSLVCCSPKSQSWTGLSDCITTTTPLPAMGPSGNTLNARLLNNGCSIESDRIPGLGQSQPLYASDNY